MNHRRLTTVFLAAAVAITAAAGLAGCAFHTLPPVEGSAASASPTTGGPLAGVPEPDTIPSPNKSQSQAPGKTSASDDASKPDHNADSQSSASNKPEAYQCESGTTIQARYPDVDTAVVIWQGHTYYMYTAQSADGARYVGRKYEWWTRGTGDQSTASLFAQKQNGATGRALETCRRTK